MYVLLYVENYCSYALLIPEMDSWDSCGSELYTIFFSESKNSMSQLSQKSESSLETCTWPGAEVPGRPIWAGNPKFQEFSNFLSLWGPRVPRIAPPTPWRYSGPLGPFSVDYNKKHTEVNAKKYSISSRGLVCTQPMILVGFGAAGLSFRRLPAREDACLW